MPSWTSEQLHAYEQRKNSSRGKIPHPEQRECPAPLAGDSKGETQGSICPHVCFTLCRIRSLDIDAKYHSIKDLLDGLQHAGLISGDKEGQITLEVKQIKVAHYKDEQTLIEITPTL